ncbi:MAG: hypothetical protein CL946_03100 [Ectothiorhodospiraceae bacterium]|nr:hypothetical protein [Ectothiorhodospiraceae bacterium]
MKTTQSISTKFILSFLIIGLIPVIIFGVISYYQLTSTIKEDKERALLTTSENKIQALKTWLEEVQLQGNILQHSQSIKDYAPIIASDPTPASQQLRNQADAALKRSLEQQITKQQDREQQDNFVGMYLIDQEGRVRFSLFDEKTPTTQKVTNAEFFRAGRVQMYVTDVMFSPISQQPCIIVSAPVLNERGETVAVLVLEVGLRKVDKIVHSRIGVGNEGQPFLLNSKGQIISSTRFQEQPILTQRYSTEGINLALANQKAKGEFEGVDGQQVIGAYVPAGINGWVIAIEIPLSEAMRASHMLAYQFIVLAIILVTIILFVARRNANKLANPLVSMTNTARLVAEGDLREKVSITSNDEVGVLGESFNTMISSLASMVRRILEMAKSIENTANGILQSTHDQEEVTLTQSSAVSETSATIEELSISAKQVAQSAQSIMQQVEGTATKILFLSEKAQEINKITTVIEEVAHQIHLLSLNASIEAARAGEHGKGFEVVASEIRKLSEKSNKQTTEIATIVEDIQNAISSAVLATEQAVNGVRSITTSVQQQDTATDQISVAMQDINQSMKKSIEGTKRTLNAVEEMKTVVRSTNEVASQFKLD